MARPNVTGAARTGVDAGEVQGTVDAYRDLYAQGGGDDPEARKQAYAKLVNQYYDLVTDFYEYGWGRSFHFAPRRKGESFEASLLRHEHYLALSIGVGRGQRVLDVGCGVGGPMTNIAHFAACDVVGINNNAYQIEHGETYVAEAGLTGRCSFEKADFMAMPFEDASFDAAYAIEATCHAPDRRGVYGEIFRTLKPGGVFASYEWCVTDAYDREDPAQREAVAAIEEGDALPELVHTSVVDSALAEVGFELLHTHDVALDSDPETPWFLPLTGKELSIRGLPHTRPGRMLSHAFVRFMEAVRLAPKGATSVSELLNRAAEGLVTGGELGIFTPMYLVVARKPKG